MLPVIRPGGSDTAMFDNVLELLTLAGRSLPHALMMMVPEAYAGRPDVSDDLRGFYRFHECLTEAWDGPAAIAFTDGTVIGATLDRNGLRPGRWLETADGWVILASETGVLDVPGLAGRAQRTAPARPAVPRRSRAGSDRARRRGEGRGRGAPPVRRVVRRRARSSRRPAASASRVRSRSRFAACSSRSATRRRT